MENYRVFVFIGFTCIALGAAFSSVWKETMGSVGPVIICLGALFFVIGLSKKRSQDKSEQR